MSGKGSKITYNNYGKQLLVQFEIYDFESITKKNREDLGEDKSYTVKSQDYECWRYGLKLDRDYMDELTKLEEMCRLEGVVHKYSKREFKLVHYCHYLYKNFNKKSKDAVKKNKKRVVYHSDFEK